MNTGGAIDKKKRTDGMLSKRCREDRKEDLRNKRIRREKQNTLTIIKTRS